MKDKNIQWHPGFVAAMDLELAVSRENLIFQKEYNLNTKPLEIDLLIEKKEVDIPVDNEIGRFFRRYNLLEYKSPQDGLSVDDLFKVTAYAALFKSYGETENAIDVDEITVTLLRESNPEKLFRYLREHDYTVCNPYQGVYYIGKRVLFKTQIIVTKELQGGPHIWLRALSEKLKKDDFQNLLWEMENFTGKREREMADSVLRVSVEANRQIIEEWKGDSRMYEVLMEIMEPEIEKREIEARKESARETAEILLRKGKMSVEEIADCCRSLTVEEIHDIESELLQTV